MDRAVDHRRKQVACGVNWLSETLDLVCQNVDSHNINTPPEYETLEDSTAEILHSYIQDFCFCTTAVTNVKREYKSQVCKICRYSK